MTEKTIGAQYLDYVQKAPETTDPIEIQREAHKVYIDEVLKTVDSGKKKYSGDFYVVVETKKERLMEMMIRNFLYHRSTCPTPQYDTSVYRYHRSDDMLEFLWVIPSKDTCELFRDNALQIVKEEKQLLEYVLNFYDGTLFNMAKRLNGELFDSPILQKERKIYV